MHDQVSQARWCTRARNHHCATLIPTTATQPLQPQPLNPETLRRHISQFQLGKAVYQGKTSSLYLAQDRPSRMPVAIKCYHKRKLSTLNM